MCIVKKICPVPFDQQPLNEYLALKSSWCFAWSTLDNKQYVLKILYIYCIFSLLFSPFIFSIINDSVFLIRPVLINFTFVSFSLILIFSRLYLGWSYVMKRLISATVFYEESGWYDGQIWIKSLDMLTKDRLIGLYEVMPLINRIKYTLMILTSVFGLNVLCFVLL